MPYLILVIGLLIGFYALYRFFLNANVNQIKAFFIAAFTLVLGVALLYLALTGKLVAALVGLVGVTPVIIGAVRKHRAEIKQDNQIIDVEPIEDDDEEDKP